MSQFINKIQGLTIPESRTKLRKMLQKHGWSKAQISAVCEQLKSTYDDEKQYEYSDNLRLARKNNEEEVTEYSKAAEDGCCGSYDETLEVAGSDKEFVLFGFNYGH